MSRFLALSLLLISSPAFALDPDPWDDTPPDGTTHSICATEIEAKRQALVKQGTNLGAYVGQLHVESVGFCWQAFQSGRIHTGTTSTSQTVAITGTVLAKFASLNYEAGLGQAFAPVTDPSGATRWRFRNGYIVVHPSYGTRAIRNPLSSLWTGAGGVARLGYPTGDQIATSSGVSYSRLEGGLAVRTNELGAWLDITGSGEGRVSASTKVYQHASFAGTVSARTLSSENPIATPTQLGALDNQISSFTVNTPGRSSLYLYETSPFDGRYLRVTGGDWSRIQVSNIGTFMNDRVSSMMLVNHGLAAQRISKADLVADLTAELGDLEELIGDDFAAHNDSTLGNISFNWGTPSPFYVWWIPGERALEVTRYGFIDAGSSWATAHAPVKLTVKLRPFVTETAIAGDPTHRRLTVHASVLSGSLLRNGTCVHSALLLDDCDELDTALATAFTSVISDRITEAFATVLDEETDDLELIQASCMNGAGVRRVNVLPDNGLEIVVADSADQNTCVQALENGGWITPLDHARPVGQITQGYANGAAAPAFDGTRTVVPDPSLPEPPTDVYP